MKLEIKSRQDFASVLSAFLNKDVKVVKIVSNPYKAENGESTGVVTFELGEFVYTDYKLDESSLPTHVSFTGYTEDGYLIGEPVVVESVTKNKPVKSGTLSPKGLPDPRFGMF